MADTVYVNLTGVDWDKLKIESYDRFTLFSRSTDDILFMMEDLSDFTLSNSVDQSEQTGSRGTVLSLLDRNKAVSGSGTNGYIICNALAAQVGGDVETASDTEPFAVPHMEKLKVNDDNTVTLAYDAIGLSGNEIPYIYKANTDMTQGTKYAIAATASDTEFAYDPATRTITLPFVPEIPEVPESSPGAGDGTPGTPAVYAFAPGDVVIVPYKRKAVVGKKIVNDSEKFSKSGRAVLDLTASDICDENIKRHVVIECNLVKMDGNFDLASSDSAMTHPFGFRSMPDPCSIDKSLWTMYVA